MELSGCPVDSLQWEMRQGQDILVEMGDLWHIISTLSIGKRVKAMYLPDPAVKRFDRLYAVSPLSVD